MSDAVLVAIIAAIPATVAVVIGLRNARSAAKAAAAAEAAKLAAQTSQAEIVATRDGVFEVGKRIDGRLSELLETSKAAARAQGHAEGVTAEQARTRSAEQ